jgi:hypothetical protein
MLNLAKKLNNNNHGRRIILTPNENLSSSFSGHLFHNHKNKLNSASVNGVVELPAMRLQFNPSLSGFRHAKEEFGRLVIEGNRELEKVWNGHPESIAAFRAIFPELVQTRGITKLQEMDQRGELFNRWNSSNQHNEINIEMEKEEEMKEKEDEEGEEYPFVAIGGPSTYAAMLLFKLRHPEKKALHIVTDRFDSNHDGSAYYYHERDAMPVYVNRVNRGPYCVYVDLKKVSPFAFLFIFLYSPRSLRLCLPLPSVVLTSFFLFFFFFSLARG